MTPQELTAKRGEDYGHPREDFTRAAIMWSAILGIKVEPEHIPLCMIAIKISREVHKHKTDNLDDIQGYAETAKMLYEKKDIA